MKTLVIISCILFTILFSRPRFPPNVTYPGELELNHQTGDILCICPRINADCYCVFREDPAETYVGEDNNCTKCI